MRDDEGESIVIIARTRDQHNRRRSCCGLRTREREQKMKSVISYLNVIRRVCDLSVNVKPSEASFKRNEKILRHLNYLWCFGIIQTFCVEKNSDWRCCGLACSKFKAQMWVTRVKAESITSIARECHLLEWCHQRIWMHALQRLNESSHRLQQCLLNSLRQQTTTAIVVIACCCLFHFCFHDNFSWKSRRRSTFVIISKIDDQLVTNLFSPN